MKTKRFWVPFGVSLVANFFIVALTALNSLMSHTGGRGPTPLEVAIFPYSAIMTRQSILALIIFVVQLPVYGYMIGLANEKRQLKTTVLLLAIIHLSAYLLASWKVFW